MGEDVPNETFPHDDYSTNVLICDLRYTFNMCGGSHMPLKHVLHDRVSLYNGVFFSVGKIPNADTRIHRLPTDRPGGGGAGAPKSQPGG